jgi:hypothetical protein
MNDQAADPTLEKWRRPVSELADNMSFVGWFAIIAGALNCLTIVGALVGVPYIFIGVRLNDAVKELREHLRGGDKEAVYRAMERQNRAFFIAKVLIIIGIVLFALYILFLIFFGFSMISNMQSGW